MMLAVIFSRQTKPNVIKLHGYVMKQTVLLLCLMIIHVSESFACSPAGQADPWFLYDIKIHQKTLPQGVSVVSKPLSVSYRPWHEDQAAYFVMNASSEPIYFYQPIDLPADAFDRLHEYGDQYHFPNSELPKQFKPRFKLENSKVYYYGRTGSKKERGYINACPSDQTCSGELEFSSIYPQINRLVPRRDSRPAKVQEQNEVLEAAMLTINSFYQGKVQPIKGAVAYRVNQKYDPKQFEKSRQQGIQACEEFMKQFQK